MRGDKAASYGAIMKVMGTINGAGFTPHRAGRAERHRRVTPMRAGLAVSAIAHAALIALGRPRRCRPTPLDASQIEPIPVDLVPIADA